MNLLAHPTFLVLVALAAAAAAAPQLAYVTGALTATGALRVFPGAPPPSGVLAHASYDAALNRTGWSFLSVSANATAPNSTLASYAAGFLEGYLTLRELATGAVNTGADQPNAKKLQKFLDANYAWMQAQIAQHAASDVYWAQLQNVLAQVEGQAQGQAAAGGALSWATLYQGLLLGGDMFNLEPLYGASPQQRARTPRLAAARSRRADHCSALVKLLPGAADLVVGHTTWSGFENLGRSLKRYDLPLPFAGGSPMPGRYTLLSGYPGLLQYSSDDIYVNGPSGLVTVETTIDNDNATLAREYASHEVVLEWLRNVLANRLATDGATWVATFSRYASGTYTNQWMVVDSRKFVPGTPPPPGTLTVLEEMPGNIRSQDRTATLTGTNGPWGPALWASYNVPSDPYLFNLSGAQQLVDRYGGVGSAGAYFSWLNTSRANIFRRDGSAVVDLASAAALLRSNSFKTDPLAALGCGVAPPYSACNAISDRSDLNVRGGDYVIPGLGHGDSAGIDAKVVSLAWLSAGRLEGGDLSMAAQSGPTITPSCPMFAFSQGSVKASHVGLPDSYNFSWVKVEGDMEVTENFHF